MLCGLRKINLVDTNDFENGAKGGIEMARIVSIGGGEGIGMKIEFIKDLKDLNYKYMDWTGSIKTYT